MRSRPGLMLVVIVLLAAACNNSLSETTDDTAQEDGCFLLENYIAVLPTEEQSIADARNAAIDALELESELNDPIVVADTILTATAVEEIDDGQSGFEGRAEAAAEIDDLFAFVNTGSEDPRDSIATLEDVNKTTSFPINAVGMAFHIKFAPGADAVEMPANPLPSVDLGTGGIVAVIDSGIVDQGPDWLMGGVIRDDIDVESVSPTAASHGTFVTSLIRQIAPTFSVSFAKAREVDAASITDEHPGLDQAQSPTTELHVLEAMIRLVNRHLEAGTVPAALNLSLGSYDCGVGAGVFQAAVDYWNNAFSGAPGGPPPIFAAGGNEALTYEFFPAAFSGVTDSGVAGIGAANFAGQEVVWIDNDEESASGLNRSWITDLAPGSNIVSLGNATTAFSWSGSSFGTAVATALSVSGKAITDDYKMVPGLTYQESASPTSPIQHVDKATGQVAPVATTTP